MPKPVPALGYACKRPAQKCRPVQKESHRASSPVRMRCSYGEMQECMQAVPACQHSMPVANAAVTNAATRRRRHEPLCPASVPPEENGIEMACRGTARTAAPPFARQHIAAKQPAARRPPRAAPAGAPPPSPPVSRQRRRSRNAITQPARQHCCAAGDSAAVCQRTRSCAYGSRYDIYTIAVQFA